MRLFIEERKLKFSVVWWVAIWDMVEIIFLDNQEIKAKRLNNQQLYDSTIKFVFDEKTLEEDKETDSEVTSNV